MGKKPPQPKWRKPSRTRPWVTSAEDAAHLAAHGVVSMPPKGPVECKECLAVLKAAQEGNERPSRKVDRREASG